MQAMPNLETLVKYTYINRHAVLYCKQITVFKQQCTCSIYTVPQPNIPCNIIVIVNVTILSLIFHHASLTYFPIMIHPTHHHSATKQHHLLLQLCDLIYHILKQVYERFDNGFLLRFTQVHTKYLVKLVAYFRLR